MLIIYIRLESKSIGRMCHIVFLGGCSDLNIFHRCVHCGTNLKHNSIHVEIRRAWKPD